MRYIVSLLLAVGLLFLLWDKIAITLEYYQTAGRLAEDPNAPLGTELNERTAEVRANPMASFMRIVAAIGLIALGVVLLVVHSARKRMRRLRR